MNSEEKKIESYDSWKSGINKNLWQAKKIHSELIHKNRVCVKFIFCCCCCFAFFLFLIHRHLLLNKQTQVKQNKTKNDFNCHIFFISVHYT